MSSYSLVGTGVALIALASYIAWKKSQIRDPRKSVVINLGSRLPRFFSVFPFLVLCALLKRAGSIPRGFKSIPSIRLVAGPLAASSRRVQQFIRICGGAEVADSNELPACYPGAVDGVVLVMKVLERPEFPISPLGIIHLRTTLRVHRAIAAAEPLRLEASVEGHRDAAKGIEFDILLKAFDKNNACAWECVETLLSLDSKKARRAPRAPAEHPEVQTTALVSFSLPSSIGRSYAAVSDDYNFHHLHPIGAKLFAGQKRHFAHGWMTFQRALYELQKAKLFPNVPYTAEVNFKLPAFLPGTLELHATGDASSLEFTLYTVDRLGVRKPHAVGNVKAE